MIVRFKDRRVRTFYSMDWKHPESKERDPQIGMKRLERLIIRFGTETKTIVIYDLQSDQLITKYRHGVIVWRRGKRV